jgi:hypothetical protein
VRLRAHAIATENKLMLIHNTMKRDNALFSKEHQRVRDMGDLKDKLWKMSNETKEVDHKVKSLKRILDEHKMQIDEKVPILLHERTE